MRYAVIDDRTGDIQNIVEWNGQAAWSPPVGHSLLELAKHDMASPGGKVVAGEFQQPPEKQKETPDKQRIADLEQRLIALEAKQKQPGII